MQKSCEGQGIQGKIDRRIAVVSIIKKVPFHSCE